MGRAHSRFLPPTGKMRKIQIEPIFIKVASLRLSLGSLDPFSCSPKQLEGAGGAHSGKKEDRGILSLFPGVSKQTDPQKPKENINEAQY